MTMNNPFRERGMIREPARFFDREGAVRAIVERLATMGSLSLVGERQIGKSSLLFYVAQRGWEQQPLDRRPAEAEDWSRALADHELHYLDMSLVQDAADFYRQALTKLQAQGETVRELQEALANRRVVFLLDEFERTANNPAFPADFFDALRGLAQTGNLALVVATQTPLVDLVAQGAISTSPFFNIFTRLDLGPLTDEEARELLQGTAALADASFSFSEEMLDLALRLAEGRPFRLQLVGRLLFEAQQSGEVNLDEIEARFRAALEPRPTGRQAAQARPASPNPFLLTLAGLFLAAGGLAGLFAALGGSLAAGTVSVVLMVIALISGGLSLVVKEQTTEAV